MRCSITAPIRRAQKWLPAPALLATVIVAALLMYVVVPPPRAATATPECPADVSNDRRVSSIDLGQVAQRFGPDTGPLYDPLYNLNDDDRISSIDLFLVAIDFGPCEIAATVYLSDLMPSQPPINGFGPMEEDASNGEDGAGDGSTLTINGVGFERGLGVHADSDARYAVPPGCTRLSAQVGIDDEVGALGAVTFEVWDGTTARLYESPVKTGADAATPVDVDITGVDMLRLVVLMGASSAFDHADWGDVKVHCLAADIIPPTIAEIAAEPGATSATVMWVTNELADARVEYGTTSAYGSSTALDTELWTMHAQTIVGLTPETTYHYRVIARDVYGNVRVSTDQTFETTQSTSLFGEAAAYPAGTSAHGVAIGDVNDDGDLDLVVANAGANTISVLHGDGQGAFAEVAERATGSQPKAVALGDVNNDGDLDAVTANQGSSNVSVLLGNASGTFDAKTDIPACTNAHEATLAHLNADANLDIACVGWGASQMRVLFGNGTGTFQPAVTYTVGSAPHSIVAGQFNADASIDLATANHDSASVSVLLGNGNGTFQPHTAYAAGTGPHSIRAGDFDNDGALDLVSANNSADTISVYFGNGNGTFEPQMVLATAQTPKGVAVADVDGDGALDILTANIRANYPTLINPGGDSMSVFPGNGSGGFGPRTDYVVGQAPFAVATGHLNGDAWLDVVTANWWDSGVTVLMGVGP